MAMKETLSWIKFQAWNKVEVNKVEVESDCMVVVHAIRSEVPMLSYFGAVIQECREMFERSKQCSIVIC